MKQLNFELFHFLIDWIEFETFETMKKLKFVEQYSKIVYSISVQIEYDHLYQEFSFLSNSTIEFLNQQIFEQIKVHNCKILIFDFLVVIPIKLIFNYQNTYKVLTMPYEIYM